MEEKLKNFCENELTTFIRFGGDHQAMINRCYGAMMFCINNCFDEFNAEIGKWWDDEMLPTLRKAQEYRNELAHAPKYVN